jgi:hypothetical protein
VRKAVSVQAAAVNQSDAIMSIIEYLTAPTPLVAVVDDDESVRESLPDLLHEFGLAAKGFATPIEYLESRFVDKTR